MFYLPLSKGQCSNFNTWRFKSRKSIKTKTTALENMINFSPFTRLVGIKLLFLDGVELEEQAESIDLVLVWK